MTLYERLHNVSWYQSFIHESLGRIEASVGKIDTAVWHISRQSEFGKLIWSWMSVIETGNLDLMVLRANTLALLADDIEYAAVNRGLGLFPCAKRLVHERRLSRTELQSVRFELGVGVDLGRAGVHFRKSESPDFHLQAGCGIECTSSRISEASASHQSYKVKIRRAVAQKVCMAYAGSSVCLCIDLSPLAAKLQPTRSGFSREEAMTAIRDAGGNKYGSVVLVTTVLAESIGTIARHFLRFDQPSINSELLQLIDKLYPIRGATKVVLSPRIPSDI